MIGRLVGLCARHPRAVLLSGALVALASWFAQRSLARDVIPDLSNPQIVLIGEWMGHSAPEVAAKVTEVLTGALEGVPGSTAVRGTSMSGMAYVDVVFRSGTPLEEGRAEILRRVRALRPKLPAAVRMQVGPTASATGWVFQYALIPEAPKQMSMAESSAASGRGGLLLPLRQYQEQVLKPALGAVPGVAEVATLGGEAEEVRIETSAEQLHGLGAAYSDVISDVQSFLQEHPDATAADLSKIPLLSKIARVYVAPAMASGQADHDGAQPIVVGIVVAKRGADPAAVIAGVKAVIERERHQLPPDSKLGVLYDRSELTGRIETTLLRALGEEVAVVAIVLLLFLLHARSALVPMITMPIVVLLTFAGMRLLGLPADVMSLGGIAIALGMAIDAEIVALEACHRRLEADGGGDRRARIVAAAGAYAPAILTSLLIAALAFVPVFTFPGETGRLLRPLAATKTLVVLAGALVTVTIAPALRDRLLARGRMIPELQNPLTRTLVDAYRPFVHFALARPALTLATAVLAAVSCLPILHRLGSEFLPRIDEGDLFYMPTTAPGVSAEEARGALTELDRDLAAFPAVAEAFGKVGRAETATDPAPWSMAETIVRLKPRGQWPIVEHERWYSSWAPESVRRVLSVVWPERARMTTSELVESLDERIRRPGWINAWTAPVQARNDMMATGVRTPVGVRIVAGDPARLDALGGAVEAAMLRVPGTRSALYEALGGERRYSFALDPDALARHGVDAERARAIAALVLDGGGMGEIRTKELAPGVVKLAAYTGAVHERPLPVRVSLRAPWVTKPAEDLVRDATVRAGPDGKGQPVPLGLLGRLEVEVVPAMLRAEAGERSGYVYVDLQEGTDLGGYVKRARAAVQSALDEGGVALRAGERIEWTGQYEILLAGRRHMWILTPVVALLMLGLLFLQFRSWTEAFIVLASVPFALVGSFWTLHLLGYKLSAPVWVGLLSVVGLAMQTGVLMVVYIDEAFHRRLREGRVRTREDVIAAHAEGTILRLRPKIMTIATMIASLLPLLWAQGAGAEIMKRVAAPMVGGLVTSAFLTLEVIPVLYTLWRTRQLRIAARTGVPLEEVAGARPGWAAREPAQRTG